MAIVNAADTSVIFGYLSVGADGTPANGGSFGSLPVLVATTTTAAVPQTTTATTTATATPMVPLTSEVLFDTIGETNWTVPASVTSISAACVGGGAAGSSSPPGGNGGGGGALGWGNNITVVLGGWLTVYVGYGSNVTDPASGFRNSGEQSSITDDTWNFLVNAAQGNGDGSGGGAFEPNGGLGGTEDVFMP